MIILRSIVVLALVLGVLPAGMGCALIPTKNKLLVYLGGLFASLTLFEIFQFIFHAVGGSLRVMTLLWCVLCAAVAVVGLRRQGRSVFAQRPRWDLNRLQTLLLVVGVALVAVQTLNTVFNTYYGNWDDETYCTNAVASWYSDLVNRFDPAMGLFEEAFYDKKYTVAGWPMYSASLAVLTGVHPAIVFRTLLPLFEIPLAYLAVWLVVRHIFKKDLTKALLAFVYAVLFTIAAAEGVGGATQEWWLIVSIWSGKGIAFNIMTPLLLWLLLELEDTPTPADRRPLWRVMFFTCGACCLIAASLYMTVPIELALFGAFYLLRTRRWKDIGHFAACVLPLAALALFIKM